MGRKMLFQPATTIRVTTKAELDAALKTADKVIVDGDDQLLTYAVAQASGDPRNDIEVQMNEDPLGLVPRGVTITGRPGVIARIRPPSPVAAPVPAKSRNRSGVWLAAIGFAVLASLALGFVALQNGKPAPLSAANTPAAAPPQPDSQAVIDSLSAAGRGAETRGIQPLSPAPDEPVSPKHAAPPKPTARSANVALVQAIAWPLVAALAILALLLVARQAIAGGRNVEFSWKVTEKVSGRVVITKVKSPNARRPHGAPA
jgi:hypothetical protein